MSIEQWAIKWGVPYAALVELRESWGVVDTVPGEGGEEVSESVVQNAIRLEAASKGVRLTRNNVGALEDKRGQWVRYGLWNDSKKMNKVFKSGDLVGIRPVAITPSHVGTTIGQFVMREVKESTWVYSGTEHERAQLACLNFITGLGGDACFANNVGTI